MTDVTSQTLRVWRESKGWDVPQMAREFRKAAMERPGLTAALDHLRAGDTLAVWKLDRLGRSVKDVLTIADDLHARRHRRRILTGKLPGSYSPTGEGKLFFTILAVFAEFERDLIRERTRDGLAATTARGRNGGRKRRLTPEQVQAAKDLRAAGRSVKEIGQLLGNGKPVSRQTVYRALGMLAT